MLAALNQSIVTVIDEKPVIDLGAMISSLKQELAAAGVDLEAAKRISLDDFDTMDRKELMTLLLPR